MENPKPKNPLMQQFDGVYAADAYKGAAQNQLDHFTLRDYFAAKAMQGLMSTNDKGTFSGLDEMCEKCAKLSYQMADYLLKQREL